MCILSYCLLDHSFQYFVATISVHQCHHTFFTSFCSRKASSTSISVSTSADRSDTVDVVALHVVFLHKRNQRGLIPQTGFSTHSEDLPHKHYQLWLFEKAGRFFLRQTIKSTTIEGTGLLSNSQNRVSPYSPPTHCSGWISTTPRSLLNIICLS